MLPPLKVRWLVSQVVGVARAESHERRVLQLIDVVIDGVKNMPYMLIALQVTSVVLA